MILKFSKGFSNALKLLIFLLILFVVNIISYYLALYLDFSMFEIVRPN